MADNKYEVLVDDLTLHARGNALTDMFGNVIGYQHKATIYKRGDVVTEDDLTPEMVESVENGETEGALRKAGADAETPVPEPFPGYSDMSVDEVQAMFTVVGSDMIRMVQDYEAEYGDSRAGIVDYHIGRGEAFTDRLTGRAGSPWQEGDDKPLADIVTREVKDDDVRFGEGPMDDGTPQRPVLSLEGDKRFEGEKVSEKPDTTAPRKGRRSSLAEPKSKSKPEASSTAPKPSEDKS